jgi:hypothetical protein
LKTQKANYEAYGEMLTRTLEYRKANKEFWTWAKAQLAKSST